MKTAIIIPARHASTRLPGKPLLAETGKALIHHVYEQALNVKNASYVAVATDDQRIFDAVNSFGGKAVMTHPDHDSGSARVAEAAAAIDADIIVNLQGDEPEISPEAIERLIDIKKNVDCFAATLACPFSVRSGAGSPDDPSAVKAILGAKLNEDIFEARYFTRTITPWPRDDQGAVLHPENYFLHVGIYAYAKDDLIAFAKAPQGALEKAERLEQLRILELGGRIVAGLVGEAAPGIDTRQDYEAFKDRLRMRAE